jgi:predicted flap endonuclease-1-like 5' DNA nuclease
VPAFEVPEGADDLTVLSSIDGPMRQALHMAGVHTLDEIARWGRSDARRMSTAVGVSEETIMHQWVFEAQAALFDRFSQR